MHGDQKARIDAKAEAHPSAFLFHHLPLVYH